MSSTESVVQRWLRQNVQQSYPAHQRVYVDADAALTRFATIRPKTDVYTYDDGRTQLLLCLHGLLPITFRASPYNIPIAIWIPRDYPREPPVAYVVPTNDMLVKASRQVDVSGRCTVDYVQQWERKSEGCNVLALLEALQEQFSREPPVYARPRAQSPPQPPGSRPLSAAPDYSSRPAPPPPGAPSYNPASPASADPTGTRPQLPPKPTSSSTPLLSHFRAASPPPAALPFAHAPPKPPPPPLQPGDLRGVLPAHGHPASPLARTPSIPPYAASPAWATPPASVPGTPAAHALGPPQPPPRPPHGAHGGLPAYVAQPPLGTNTPQPYLPPPPFYKPPPPLPPAAPISVQNTGPVMSPPPAPTPNLLDEDDNTGAAPAPAHVQATMPARPPNPELLALHAQVHAKLSDDLASLRTAMAADGERLRAHQADLLAGAPAIRDESARLMAVRDVCRTVSGRLRGAVEQAEAVVSELKRKGEPEVDELVCSTSIVHNQLINLVAEDNAIEDTIYHLHRALNAGRIDLERFLRTTRVLAEEQFMKRALVEKIEAGLAMH